MRRIVIIGGGFSGTLVAVHLLRAGAAREPLQVTLIERAPVRANCGVAYSTPYDACLLNVPAARMSAFEEEPDHFLQWVRRSDSSAGGGSFLPRRVYGEYLRDLRRDASSLTHRNLIFQQLIGEAVALADPPEGDASVTLADGTVIPADYIVLALGNFPPADPPSATAEVLESERYTRDPWAPGVLARISTRGPILFLGSGLTMLDVALVLQDAGHALPIVAVSRRGLLPQAHRMSATAPPVLALPASLHAAPASPLELLRALRREVHDAGTRGHDWREVLTSLRPHTQRLWQGLDVRGRRQFLRHLHALWETHRHRAAPRTAQRIEWMRSEGKLFVKAARVLTLEQSPDSIHVTLRLRGENTIEHLNAAHVINCTGPDTDVARAGSALLRSSIRDGLCTPDELGLGLLTSAEGAVVRRDGSTSKRLRAIGAVRKAQLWETVAVPELRVQALDLAAALLHVC